LAPMTRQRLVRDAFRRSPPGLCERKVHAHRVDVHEWRQILHALLEPVRADVAHWSIERVHDVEEAHASRTAGKRHLARERLSGGERVEREGRRGVARLELLTDHGEANVAFEGFAATLVFHTNPLPLT